MRHHLLALATLLLVTTATRGMFMMPERVPLQRLERNISAYVKAHPKEAKGYYTLGRIHYLALASRTGTIGVYGEGRGGGKGPTLPSIAPTQLQPRPEEKDPPVTAEELTGHVRGAVENFRKAIELQPENGLYHLSLASVLEAAPAEAALGLAGFPPGDPMAGKDWAQEAIDELGPKIARLADADPAVRERAVAELRAVGARAVTAAVMRHETERSPEVRVRLSQVVKGYWEDRAIEEYARAYELSIAKDREAKHKPLWGLDDLVSYEAGSHYLSLTSRRAATAQEQKVRAAVAEGIKTLDALPPGPITPIIFSLSGGSRLADLLDGRRRVTFDLDGTARGSHWPWVRPTTGILVWDPAREGRITSGRQLFGNVTFGLIWADGFEPLAALDDDGDGQLAGRELDGLRVWFDRNGDGVSAAAEVVDLERTCVDSLAVRATASDGESPMNRQGVRLRDGAVLPAYDWVATPGRK